MAQLVVNGALTVDADSEVLAFADTTGVFDATLNPGGYGAPNKATSANVFTRFDFILPDLSTYRIDRNGASVPSSGFIPKNGLTTNFSIADLGLSSDEFPGGVIQLSYKPYFSTASGGTLTFTNGSAIVARGGVQDLTVDFADTNMVLWNGVEYVIKAGTLTASQFELTEVYTGSTNTLVAYAGYLKQVAVLIYKEFLNCWDPQWAVLDTKDNCMSEKEMALFNLYCIYLSILAKMAEATQASYASANTLMLDLIQLCTAEATDGGCGCTC